MRPADVGKRIGGNGARVCLHGSASMARLRRSGCREHSVEPHRCEANRYTAVVEMLMGMQNGFDIPSFGNQGRILQLETTTMANPVRKSDVAPN